ncbi:MAG: hypothetical protein IKN57_14330, partial [Parasporobacterium sp.]|nr:hypothetical protein [Parasporobacterium sp.]
MRHFKKKRPASAAIQLSVCVLILFVFTVFCRFILFRTFHVSRELYLRDGLSPIVSEEFDPENFTFLDEDPGIVELRDLKIKEGIIEMDVIPKKQGNTFIRIMDNKGDPVCLPSNYKVTRFNTIYDLSSGNFTGDSAILIAVTLFWLASGLIMFWHFLQAKGPAFYAYSTIYFAGFSIFSFVTFADMLFVTLKHILDPSHRIMYVVYENIAGASVWFLFFTSPLVLLFSVAMTVSNIELLRHERFRIQNVLGLIVAVLLVGCDAFLILFTGRGFSGSYFEGKIFNMINNILATVFVYFECILAGS